MYVDPNKEHREFYPKKAHMKGWKFWYSEESDGLGRGHRFVVPNSLDPFWILGIGEISLIEGWWTWSLEVTRNGVERQI